MKKPNIAELLKDCPKGMELYSTIYGTVYFEGVRDTGNAVLIDVKTSCNTEVQFYPDGKLNTYYSDSEITLFPSKNVRSWEGFVPPCKFKDEDVLFVQSAYSWILIYKESENKEDLYKYVAIPDHPYRTFMVYDSKPLCYKGDISKIRFATEEEKQKLFDAIKANGYKWSAETKTLEKLVEPKFKVGDRIKHKENTGWVCTIRRVTDRYYVDGHPACFTLLFDNQNEYELVPNKFDITTLKPFDKVLVRQSDNGKWGIDFFGSYTEGFYHTTGSSMYIQCVPYESNEHLLGTTDDCDEFYKTW